MENENTNTENTGTDVDALYEEITGQEKTSVIPEQAAPAPEEYVFKVDGKEVKGNRGQMIKWAEMGYGAPNRIGNLNKKLSEYESQINNYKKYEEQYKPVDEYIQKNPDWWTHVQDQWKQRDLVNLQRQAGNAQANGQAIPDAVIQQIQSLQQELADVKQFKQEVLTKQQEYQSKVEDEAYVKELDSIKAKYPDMDFTSLDANGRSLEWKVLDHATRNNIGSFRASFNDLFHDELQKRAMEKGKEAVANEKIKRTKLGLLGESPAPKKQVRETAVRGKSYENLLAEAIDELG